MPRLTTRPPAYVHHRPSGQARVRLGGRDFYLGPYGSEESRREYDRVVAEWLAAGRQAPTRPATAAGSRVAPDGMTVTELVAAYWRFADGYYVKGGQPTSEVHNIRLALRPLKDLYCHTPARDFGPLALKAVRDSLIGSGLLRSEINKRVGRIVRCFKWAVSEELVPPEVLQALKAVSGLRKGRSGAPEGDLLPADWSSRYESHSRPVGQEGFR